MSTSVSTSDAATVAKPVKRLRGKRSTSKEPAADSTDLVKVAKSVNRVVAPTQIPAEISENVSLNEEIKHSLPSNYNFEIHKTLWRLQTAKAKMVALQFPEGFQMYACIIADLLQKYAGVETLIMGDVTYGACCVDDFTARALGCDFMVHYGHSCLVPIDVTLISTLYVFVEIAFDPDNLVRSIQANFKPTDHLVLAGTIQFSSAVQTAASKLKPHFASVLVPQAKPLSRGEVLGCTSPKFEEAHDALIFIADGRFHLESMMIHNPHIKAFYKYDPYSKKLTIEQYGHQEMHTLRQSAISTASKARKWGVIIGTLGRQGSLHIIKRLETLLTDRQLPYITVLLSEIMPAKLASFDDVDAWVQVACPRLSIDWGYAFDKPLLSPYEFEVALGTTQWKDVYPMDYYAKEGGTWTNYAHQEAKKRQEKEDKSSKTKKDGKRRGHGKIEIEHESDGKPKESSTEPAGAPTPTASSLNVATAGIDL